MSVNDSISDLATDTLTVHRFLHASYVNGVYTQGSPTVLTIGAVVQPAYNINRVVGGADMHATDGENQKTTDVRQLHTTTQLFTQNDAKDPDVIIGFEGGDWTVIRVEKWVLIDETHYHCIISRQTRGAA